MKLGQRLRDNGDEWQVKLGDVSANLGISVTRVCIMTAQQRVYCTDGLLVQEEDTEEESGVELA